MHSGVSTWGDCKLLVQRNESLPVNLIWPCLLTKWVKLATPNVSRFPSIAFLMLAFS
jgi:hypothetical protein